MRGSRAWGRLRTNPILVRPRSILPWVSDEPDDERADFSDPNRGTTPVDAHPAGVTPGGVNDLAGNVWEWCQDHRYKNYEGAPNDGSTWEAETGGSRMLRGGAFHSDPRNLLAAYRISRHRGNRGVLIGFRGVWRVAGGQEN